MEKLRFEERLKVEYRLGPQDFLIPPLTLQPIVENAVRHGIMKKANGGTIVISTDERKEDWAVTVEDDGPGFDPADLPMRDGVRHVGICNVEQRLEYYAAALWSYTAGKETAVAAVMLLANLICFQTGEEAIDYVEKNQVDENGVWDGQK